MPVKPVTLTAFDGDQYFVTFTDDVTNFFPHIMHKIYIIIKL